MGLRAALIGCLLLAAACARAADDNALAADRIKAAFLFKFAAYVGWPAAAFAAQGSPITACIAGAERIADELDQASAGRTVADRPLQVRRIRPPDFAALPGCHIVFVSGANRRLQEETLARTQGKAILAVTDSEGGHPQGSIINFVVSEGRVRFDISRETAEKAGLQLRSQLLTVARNVAP